MGSEPVANPHCAPGAPYRHVVCGWGGECAPMSLNGTANDTVQFHCQCRAGFFPDRLFVRQDDCFGHYIAVPVCLALACAICVVQGVRAGREWRKLRQGRSGSTSKKNSSLMLTMALTNGLLALFLLSLVATGYSLNIGSAILYLAMQTLFSLGAVAWLEKLMFPVFMAAGRVGNDALSTSRRAGGTASAVDSKGGSQSDWTRFRLNIRAFLAVLMAFNLANMIALAVCIGIHDDAKVSTAWLVSVTAGASAGGFAVFILYLGSSNLVKVLRDLQVKEETTNSTASAGASRLKVHIDRLLRTRNVMPLLALFIIAAAGTPAIVYASLGGFFPAAWVYLLASTTGPPNMTNELLAFVREPDAGGASPISQASTANTGSKDGGGVTLAPDSLAPDSVAPGTTSGNSKRGPRLPVPLHPSSIAASSVAPEQTEIGPPTTAYGAASYGGWTEDDEPSTMQDPDVP